MKRFFVLILTICSACGLYLLGNLYQSTSERNVEQHLSNLSADGLTKIGIYGLGERVELYTLEAQEEILNHLSKMEAVMGVDGSNTETGGGIVLEIRLFYDDGSEELVTLPAYKYPTLLGDRGFFLTIDGETVFEKTKIWDPFRKYFRLLQK